MFQCLPIRMRMSTSNSKRGRFLNKNKENTNLKGRALMHMYTVVAKTKRGNNDIKFRSCY